MDNAAERMHILELIESGQITAAEGLRRLAALPDPEEPESVADASKAFASVADAGPESASPAQKSSDEVFSAVAQETGEFPPLAAPAAPEVNSTDQAGRPADETAAPEPLQPEIVSEAQREDFERWKGYWMIPLWIGVGVTILGGLLMYWALESAGIGFWFFCATLPFIIGVLAMVVGAQSRTARWLHLRVQQAPGERPQRIAISFPIPIGLASWFFRTFRYRIPGLDTVPVNIDEILTSVRDSTSPENPIYIRVDEDEDDAGEKVEIYIG